MTALAIVESCGCFRLVHAHWDRRLADNPETPARHRVPIDQDQSEARRFEPQSSLAYVMNCIASTGTLAISVETEKACDKKSDPLLVQPENPRPGTDDLV